MIFTLGTNYTVWVMPFRYPFVWLVRKFRKLGPGFITGAADDDPSGIATYSIAGAQFGYNLSWLCLFLTPLMYAVQETSGRIGMCSGMGLSAAIKKYYPRKILVSSILLLVIANTINIGADLGFMAATLNFNGITDIETPQQAAMALRPLAGNFAYLLFTLGIIGIGLQSVPILSGGVAYAFTEAFNLQEGLSKRLSEAKAFYGVIGLAMVFGAALNLIGINPIRALYYAAIVNGVTSVPLIAVIIKLSNDKRVVGQHTSTKLVRILSWITLIFLTLASGLMLYNLAIRY